MSITVARSPRVVTTNRVLAGRWIDLLHNGDTDGQYPTSYQAVMAVATAACRAGWSLYDWTSAMSDPRNDLAAHYRRKDDGRCRTAANADGRVRRDWAKATRYAAEHPQLSDPSDVMQNLGLVRAAVATASWTGRAGLRNRIILGVILDLAETKPTACPTISTRSLCEQTPYRGRVTVQRALDDLADAGWLTKDRSRSAADAPTAYRIDLPRVAITGPAGCAPTGGVGAGPVMASASAVRTGPVDRINHDLGIRFGAHAALIFSALDPDIPQSVATITRRSGAARSTVKKWLPELAIIGLAYKTPSGWHQGMRDVELVAIEQGAMDAVEARQIRHELQRKGWTEWCTARAADTS